MQSRDCIYIHTHAHVFMYVCAHVLSVYEALPVSAHFFKLPLITRRE